LGNNKVRAWKSSDFAHKKRGCDGFDTPSFLYLCMKETEEGS